MGVNLLEVVGNSFVWNVPFAIVARGNVREALGAKQRPAVEVLFESRPFVCRGSVDVERQCNRCSALVARVLVLFQNDRLVVIVQSAWHDAGTRTERAFHRELGQDRLADELAFVLELAEKLREFLLDLERDDLGFLSLLSHSL